MIYNGRKIYTEEPSAADAYRKRYTEGINGYIKKMNKKCAAERFGRMTSQALIRNTEEFRKQYRDMLGIDRICSEVTPDCKMVRVGSDDTAEIFRLTVYITEEIPFYALLLIPNGAVKAPLIIAQHGGGGTPELCCDIYGKNNYNHMARRALNRGAAVLAPQLLLWANTETDTMRAHEIAYDRRAADNDLKRFGLSITGLEISGIMKCIDWACGLDAIDESKIGMIGLSYGGYFTLHTMAADTRIRAGYSSGCFNNRDIYNWQDWCYFGSALNFQDAEVAALCAPRPLFVHVGKTDDVFDWRSAVSEAERASKYYAEFGCAESFRFSVWDGGHTVSPNDDGYDFLFSALERCGDR